MMNTDQPLGERVAFTRRCGRLGFLWVFIGAIAWAYPGVARATPEASRSMTSVVQEALAEHRLIFISDPHGNEALAKSEVRLFAELDIPDQGLDLVLEFLNPVHQSRLDAYFLELETTPSSELSTAWYDSTDIGTWQRDDPSVLGLVEAVRARNEALPKEQRIRVLGGGAPVDWGKVESIGDLTKVPPKNRYAIALVRQLLGCEGERPILVVYGNAHLVNPFWGAFGDGDPGQGYFVFSFYKAPQTCGEETIEWFDSVEAGASCLSLSPGFSRGRATVAAAFVAGRGALLGKVEPLLSEGFQPQSVTDPELLRRMELYRTDGSTLEELYRRNAVIPEFPRCRP